MEEGKTISKRPRKDKPKNIKMKKKNRFGAQWVEIKLANSGPLIRLTRVPIKTYNIMILKP
jgi:hypothetical protein